MEAGRSSRSARHRERNPVDIRAGDIAASWGQLTDPFSFYRPASNRMLYRTAPTWMRAHDAWYGNGDGQICTYRHRAVRGAPLRTSDDHGVTWARTSTEALPTGTGRILNGCLATDGTTILITGSREYLRRVHTLDPDSGDVLSSHRLATWQGQSLDPYDLHSLSDGTLVAGTHRRGVYVGTDATNATLRFRPGDVPDHAILEVVSDELVVTVYDERTLQVSADRGVTWKTVNPRFAR